LRKTEGKSEKKEEKRNSDNHMKMNE